MTVTYGKIFSNQQQYFASQDQRHNPTHKQLNELSEQRGAGGTCDEDWIDYTEGFYFEKLRQRIDGKGKQKHGLTFSQIQQKIDEADHIIPEIRHHILQSIGVAKANLENQIEHTRKQIREAQRRKQTQEAIRTRKFSLTMKLPTKTENRKNRIRGTVLRRGYRIQVYRDGKGRFTKWATQKNTLA